MSNENLSYFSLRRQFVFYASYHNNPVNIFIHLLCIWNLFWSFSALLQFIPPFTPTPAFLSNLPLGHLIAINAPLITAIIWPVCWMLLEPVVGFIGGLMTVSIYFLTSHLVQQSSEFMGYPLFQALLVFHLFCWILQFIGHGVFEGRAPALLKSLDQAFITAPLFVLLEVCFYFGYRKEFYKECMLEVEKNIKEFKEGKSK